MPGNLSGRQLDRSAQSPEHDPELDDLIQLYLHGDYQVRAPGSLMPDVICLVMDDITEIRAAKRLADKIQTADAGLPERPLSQCVTGSVLQYLIGELTCRAGMSPALPDAGLVGEFSLMLVESFLARVRLGVQPQSIAAPSRWSEVDCQAFVRLSERLWRCGDLAGLSRPELDPLSAEAAIRTMALLYTVAHFARLEPQTIDVLALAEAAGQIERRLRAELQRRQRRLE